MSNDDAQSTYVVQIFSVFAPPELRPLLVRLESEATVEDCIQTSLNKYLQRQPLMVLPSDVSSEYALSMAGGDGNAIIGAHAFEPRSVLRTISALEFPFMLCLTFAPLSEAADPSASSTEMSVHKSSGAPSTRQVQHKTLTALEKQALAKELKERERVREENLRIIERRRVDREREAYQHCESYEVERQELQRKQQQEKERLEMERELQEQEAQMKLEAEMEVANTSNKERTLLEKHREEMAEAVEAEKRRIQDALVAKSERIQQASEEKQRLLALKKQQLAAEKNARMARALESLVDGLHESISHTSMKDTQRLEHERFDRKDVERMEGDLRNIASLEERRHAPKDAERTSRFLFLASRDSYEANKTIHATQLRDEQQSSEAERFDQWLAEEAKRKEALVAQLELEYRSREGRQAITM